jgi:hypothetical protein
LPLRVLACTANHPAPGSAFGGGSGGGGFGGGGGGGAGLGGALFNDGGAVTLTNSTLAGNAAQGGAGGTAERGAGGSGGAGVGGAVFTRNGSLTAVNVTIASNNVVAGAAGTGTAGSGSRGPADASGIEAVGDGDTATVRLSNSIVADTPSNLNDFLTGSLNGGVVSTSGTNNLIRTNNGFQGAKTITGKNPLLNSLADNGGPTQTMAPLDGSLVVRAGDNNSVTAPPFAGPPITDQRGQPRLGGGTVDLGAFQDQITVTAPAGTQAAAVGTSQSFALGSFADLNSGATGWTGGVAWGDNSAVETFSVSSQGGLSSRSHTFAAAGTYTVTVAVENSFGDVNETTFQVSVGAAPAVTQQPANTTVNAGANATFTASASGSPTPSVQWQVSTDGGTTWSPLTGATSTSLSLSSVTAAMNGNRYRAIFTNSLGTATTSAAVLTVDYAPKVTAQPVSQTVNAGQSVTFSASASGNPTPNVQWVQVNTSNQATPVIGATSTTLTLTNVTASMNGYQYYAVFTNSVGGEQTKNATLTVDFAPIVVTQPTTQVVNAGQTATFSVAANANPGYTVLWQVSTDGGTTFNAISGATGQNLTLTNVTASMNGNRYEAVLTNSVGSTTTNAAMLVVDFAPSITAQPTDQAVNAGQTATFTVSGTANPDPEVMWDVSTDGGKTFTFVSGGPSDFTLTLTNVDPSMNGYEYRARLFNGVGSGEVVSNAATLTVNVGPTVTTQPTDQTVNAGQTATFTAAATGNPAPTVQWEELVPGSSIPGVLTGETSPTLTLDNVAASLNGTQYRAVFTNSAGTAATNWATLTVDFAPTITTQPASQTINAGDTVTFTAAADANPAATVQWLASVDGGQTWITLPGANSTTLVGPNLGSDFNGSEYKAVFTNSLGTATTNVATLTVDFAPAIANQPTGQYVFAGDTVTFTAAANANPAATVQWQVSTDGGNTFSPLSGATSATLSFTAAAGQNGNQYEAVFTNSLGSTTTSSATLTVFYGPTITTQPLSQTVNAGQAVTFTAAAVGNPTPSVVWQVSSDRGFSWMPISDATTGTLTLTGVQASMNGYQYRASFLGSGGAALTSAATLTVDFAPTITMQPVSQAVPAGQTVIFNAAAAGNPVPTVQWQASTDNGKTFTDIAGATAATLSFTSAASLTGNQYRAVFSNSLGSATSAAATLTAQVTPSFSGLSSPTILVHTASVTLSGTITSSSGVPSGSVSVTLNGLTKTAAIKSDGTFSVTFATKTLAAGSYGISYSFAGGGVFLPASGSGTLQVTYNPVRIVLPLGGTTPRRNMLQLAFQLLDAAGLNVGGTGVAVTAVGVAPAGNPSAVQPVRQATPGTSSSQLAFAGGAYTYFLDTSALKVGTYLFLFTVQGDPVLHSVQFQLT